MIIRLLCWKCPSLFLAISCLICGCHEEPTLPNSIIPYSCWVAQVDYIDTTSVVTYTYQYDKFGNQIKSKYTSPTGGSEERIYEFDTDQYLIKQQVNGATYTYEYDSNSPKRIKRITGNTYSYEYIYDAGTLKTYIIKNGGGTDQYEFGSDGRLKDQDLTLSNGEKISIKGGKIVLRTATNGIVTASTYDTKGQLTKQIITNPSANVRTETTYTYDNGNFYPNASLRARGFPGLLPDGQPGHEYNYAGGPVQINNYLTETIDRYNNTTNALITTKSLTYRHQYNRDNFSLGYARSDGARAKFNYINCN